MYGNMIDNGIWFEAPHDHYEHAKTIPSLINQRIKYIKQIKLLREAEKCIWYFDESWVNLNMSVDNVWLGSAGGSFKIPSGKGGRIIVLHVGGEQGWLPGAEIIQKGYTDVDADYHT